MNSLDQQIQNALRVASELPEIAEEPTLTQEILDVFQGKNHVVMILTGVKMAAAGILMYVCIYQFFQQESMMAMIAYATATIIFGLVAACIMLFLWVKVNHNTTTREIKRLELQVALLIRELHQNKESHVTA
jgi:uncharacterized membrane protein YciS (DUF1049 family)